MSHGGNNNAYPDPLKGMDFVRDVALPNEGGEELMMAVITNLNGENTFGDNLLLTLGGFVRGYNEVPASFANEFQGLGNRI